MHIYKLTNKETGEVKFATHLVEAGEGYDILGLEDGTEVRVENVEMNGSNLTNETYTVEAVTEEAPVEVPVETPVEVLAE